MSKRKKSTGALQKSVAEHLFTHLSEYALRDAENRMSYINVVQNVVLNEIPGALLSLFVSVGFTGPPGEKYSIAIEDPNKKDIFRSPDDDVPKGIVPHPAMRHVSNATLLLKPAFFLMEGVYHVVLRVGDKVINKEPFPVIKAAVSESGGTNASAS